VVEVMVGGGVGGDGGGAVEVGSAGGAEAQTFSSFLPSFLFIVGGAGSWCRLLVTERGGMAMGSSVEQGSVQCTTCQLLSARRRNRPCNNFVFCNYNFLLPHGCTTRLYMLLARYI
jgi:hypothetical protein